jgi:alpha-methylacyl-CoA racemase
MHAISGIAMALFARERSGRGQLVDISYLDTAFSLLSSTRVIRDYLADPSTPRQGTGALSGQFAYYRVYEASDGKYITVGCIEPWLWTNLCRALHRPDLIDGGSQPADFMGMETQRQIECRRAMELIFKTRSRDDWFEFLRSENVCVGKVYEVSELFDDPQLKHRGMVHKMVHPTLGEVSQVGIAIKLSDTPGSIRSFAPWKGQHTTEILSGLGYGSSEIKALLDDHAPDYQRRRSGQPLKVNGDNR